MRNEVILHLCNFQMASELVRKIYKLTSLMEG